MAIDLDEFHREFFQDVIATADADEKYLDDAFFELFCSDLIDAGELDTADRAHFVSPRGLRVDGYGGDPLGSEGTLSLIIADFNQSPAISTLIATDMDAIFKRLSNFLARSLDQSFRNELEESTPAFGLADLIAERWSGISRIRLLLITNRLLSSRVDGRPAGEYLGVPVTYNVWDIRRLHRFATAGHGQEEIEIDLEDDFGGQELLLLPAHLEGTSYEAYLAVLPGPQLAAIYDRWGARLLEQNVRSFLQARGNVNKGIRSTLENEPEMFFAYNNGITATAEGVETMWTDRGLVVTKIRNLQIVNGGQTTASIHAASRRKDVDLSRVFVQMKLSIVAPSLAERIVPKISEYANTQNRVNAADFFANHPFHVRMEGFSRRLLAPSADGTFRESKWFYERARGQYQDARANLTQAEKRKFDLEYPKRQLFTKTDLAKFLNVWFSYPHIVSRGAQKNFAHFAEAIGKEWERQPLDFNEDYFRTAIAKAIVFRETEKLVTDQSWYQGGYRANIVAYAIAKLADDAANMGLEVDFEGIWKAQQISSGLREALEIAAKAANDTILDTDKNVTEWAKQQACWSRVAALHVDWPQSFVRGLITAGEKREKRKAAQKDQKMLVGIEAQRLVVDAGDEFWEAARNWGLDRDLLSPTDDELFQLAASVGRGKIPTDKQSERILQTLKRLHGEGCTVGADIL